MNHPHHKEPWPARLARALGFAPESLLGRRAIAGATKHGRARMLAHDWKAKARTRRKMAKASRKRNRV